MKKIKILLASLLVFCNLLYGQRGVDFSAVDRIILDIPDSLTTSSSGIAHFINSNFTSDEKKLRAIYVWIAENIQYDIENMYSFYQSSDETVDITLRTRKGVCQDFAELFNDIANRVGVKSYVITGYTKQSRKVSYNPHSWCAAKLGHDWFIFDPTWGSGSVQNSEFTKRINDDFFKLLPKQSISSHMPFDPLWQFLDYPITNAGFCSERFSCRNEKVFFNYNDTLKVYENQSEVDRLISTVRRIEDNCVNSFLIYTIICNLQENVRNYNYNRITNYYNDGIFQLNRFIDYRNKQFNPYRGDTCVQQMLDSVEMSFKLASECLKINNQTKFLTKSSLDNFTRSIDAALINLNEQKEFLERYLKTFKNYRKSLFYDKM